MRLKTKIVATVGPACNTEKDIKELYEAGVSVFRLNFSHGSLQEHKKVLSFIRGVQQESLFSASVLGDLCGPKIRVGTIVDDDSQLKEGERVEIVRELSTGSARHFGTNYDKFVDDVCRGQQVLIDDGNILLEVRDKLKDMVICEVVRAGVMSSYKGINLPNTDMSISSITEKDWECIDWAVENDLDFIGISFVRSSQDVITVKEYIDRKKSGLKIVAKIEKPAALDDLEQIIEHSDAVMVARGDLGVEMALERVPLLQKKIIGMCRGACKPCIVATQMLESMIDRAVPTRAEVSDIANAVFDRTDAVMLSGETAVGRNPLEAVKWMIKSARISESYLDRSCNEHKINLVDEQFNFDAALAESVAKIIDDVKAAAVVTYAGDNRLVQMLSNARIDVPTVVFSDDARRAAQMSLSYGVLGFLMSKPDDFSDFSIKSGKFLVSNGLGSSGQGVIYVTGGELVPDSQEWGIIIGRL